MSVALEIMSVFIILFCILITVCVFILINKIYVARLIVDAKAETTWQRVLQSGNDRDDSINAKARIRRWRSGPVSSSG